MVQLGAVALQRDLGNHPGQTPEPTSEYALTLNVDSNIFFKDIGFTIDGSANPIAPEIPIVVPSGTYMNIHGLQAALQDPGIAHFQHGTKCTLMRYAFPLDCKGFSMSQNASIGSYRTVEGVGKAILYAVFFDENGHPVRHWSRTASLPDEITVYYEYFGSDQDTYTSSFEVASKLAGTLGIPGDAINTSIDDESLINVISGPLTIILADDGSKSTFENAVMLQSTMPRIKGFSIMPQGTVESGPLFYDSNGPIAITTDDITGLTANKVNLVRAKDARLQTLIFSIISDDATSTNGITDALALMLVRPDNIIVPSLYADNGASELNVTDATLLTDSMQGSSYVCRTLANALTIHFPAVAVGTFRANIANMHKAMPKATLGDRLLQLYSLEYYHSNADEQEDILPDEVYYLLNVEQGIGKVMDLTGESEALQQDIIGQMEAYFGSYDARRAFMTEFWQKYPGVLEAYASRFDPGTLCKLKDAIDFTSKTFAIYVNISVSYDFADGSSVTINDVPVIFRLSK